MGILVAKRWRQIVEEIRGREAAEQKELTWRKLERAGIAQRSNIKGHPAILEGFSLAAKEEILKKL